MSDGKDYSNVDFGENVGDASNPEDLKFKEYYRKDILSKDPNYKKVKVLVSTGINMIPEVGEVKLGIEIFVGEDLLTEEKYGLIDKIQTSTLLSKNIASRGMNRLENQLSDSKNSQNLKTELYTENQQGQNSQQHQRAQDNVVQNNKNSINKTQAQGNQDYSANQQISKGSTSNSQQGTPVSKTSDVNKLEVSKGASDTTQKNDSANKKPILQESKDDIIEKRGNYTIYDDYAKGPKGRIYDKVAVSKNGEIVYEKHGKNYIIENNGTKTFVEYDKNTGEIKKSFERVNRYSKEFLNTLYSKYDKLENGNYRNKETGEIIEAPINIGHGYGFEHRRYVKAAQQVGMPDQKTFREYMNTQANHFKLESESGNKSHKDEKVGVDGTEDIEKDMKKFLEDKNNKNKK